MNVSGNRPSDFRQCAGSGDVDDAGNFAKIEIRCRESGSQVTVDASGKATAGGPVQITFEPPGGRKYEVVFK